MGLMDKAKNAGKKGIDLGKKAGKKGIEVGKKGVDKGKETVRKKTCGECKHYTSKSAEMGDCPIAGERLASADAATCPQKAFEPRQ